MKNQRARLPIFLRVVAIIQLSFAFSSLIYYFGYPFMGELFTVKSHLQIYDAVLEGKDPSLLSEQRKEKIRTEREAWQKKLSRSFLEKITDSLSIVLYKIPPFERAWIFFSITIAILSLLAKEGVRQAAWVLPCLVLAHSADIGTSGLPEKSFSINKLYPKEEELVAHYMKEPMQKSIGLQKEQLEKAFGLYLIETYLKEAPANNQAILTEQLAKARLRFNLARLEASKADYSLGEVTIFRKKSPPLFYLLYFFWNLFFAVALSLGERKHSLTPLYKQRREVPL